MSSVFDPVIRGRLFELDTEPPVSADKAMRDLGWTPCSNDEAIIATAKSLVERGLTS